MWQYDALIYQIDPSLFADANADGWGDFRGIQHHLGYVRSLGASTLWLLPFYRSPRRDGGYDITDHLSIDPRFGDIADFTALLERAETFGLRVLVELVMQHTSIDHPWFQAARKDRDSPYRDYYVWADEPPDDSPDPVFPGVEDSVWTWDETAGQFYRHMFYAHEPDLDLANPRVREEMYRIMAYWLRLGVAGFRIDAVPYMIERAAVADPTDRGLWLLDDMHRFAWRHAPGAILMGEADIPIEQYPDYYGGGDRLTHLLDFALNNRMFLSFARGEAGPMAEALDRHARTSGARDAVWLRNNDELDLEQLSPGEREEVFRAFAPDPDMRIYGRGIRRRIAPMFDGDRQRLAMAHAMLLSLPGVPVLRYGEEIGMGEDLSRPERTSVRTPMQWHDGHNAGFSRAAPEALCAGPIDAGPFAYHRVNVESQLWRRDSLLTRIRDMTQARLALSEFGGDWRVARLDCDAVLGLRYDDAEAGSTVIALTNFSGREVAFPLHEDDMRETVDVLYDAAYEPRRDDRVALNAYGYRWLRRRHA